MIPGGGEVGHEHAEEVEADAEGGPAVASDCAPHDEQGAHDDGEGNAAGM